MPIGRDRPSGVVVTADALWVASADNTVTRLDPATGAVIAVVKVGQQPAQGAEARDGTIWVPNLAANTVSVIDPASNAVVRTVKTGSGPFVVHAGFGDMWIGSFRGKDLWRIRP